MWAPDVTRARRDISVLPDCGVKNVGIVALFRFFLVAC